MAISVDPGLLVQLKKYGVQDATTCFNCGNCTAVCSLSTENTPFPRKVIRYLQIGAEEKLLHAPEPWLCYYCGDCSETCPRDANPGEVMMGLRRYLTARYDWTGISRLFYTSKVFEIFAILFVGALVGLGFFFFHGPVVTDRVALNEFASSHVIEILDLIMLVILSGFLLSNARRMAKAVLGDPAQYEKTADGEEGATAPQQEVKKWNGIPVSLYINELKTLLVNFVTQKKFKDCNSKTQSMQWLVHLLIMTGYSTIFVLVVVFLRWFQRDEILPFWSPVRLLGYYGTFAILYGTTYAIIGRLKKVRTVYKYSHSSDWAFLILLWLTTFTGILIHFTRLLGMPLSTYYIYVIHMMIAVPMLVLEVPFAKWAHLLYRPLALYLMRVKERALT
ncbi:QmoC [Desulfomarina profundi]|uniref:QmoC n=1 Tax=Desulfomarina profundi TaxID=2772557 RepID=A0A8D5FKD7_9BACT|nr:4Fe-4S dicluster domain-containing protein [Desulfomarina profundi]BCL62983.1 QmoC [Desulfomarina profundi]